MNDNPYLNFYFPDDSILVVTDNEDYLLSLLKTEKKPLSENKEIFTLVEKIEGKNHYWMVTDQPGFASIPLKKLFNINESRQFNDIIKSLKHITLSIIFSDEAEVNSVLTCSSTRNAFLFSSAIRGAIALDLFSQKNYELGEIIENINLERKNNDIVVKINLDNDDIKKVKRNSQIDLNWNNFRN
jgi:hypothetical protein